MIGLIRSIAASGTGVILVTHHLATVRALADRIVVLSLGRVVYDGSAKHVTEAVVDGERGVGNGRASQISAAQHLGPRLHVPPCDHAAR